VQLLARGMLLCNTLAQLTSGTTVCIDNTLHRHSVPLLGALFSWPARFNVQRQLQSRLLRSPHPHAHYGNAAIVYVKGFVQALAPRAILVSVDCKAHIPPGEPDLPVQAVTRQRAVLAIRGQPVLAGTLLA